MDDIDKCIYECIYQYEKEIFRNIVCIIMYFYCADTTKNNRENCKIKRKKQMGLTKKFHGYTIVADTKQCISNVRYEITIVCTTNKDMRMIFRYYQNK